MLQYLKIKNLALLNEVTLEFSSGFTAVTGETGAGKSVLLGALNLLSGARTDKGLIREGAEQLEVEGALYFEDSQGVDDFLDSIGLPPCEDGLLLLQRRIHLDKMSRILINGSMATLSQLQATSEWWIDFHGPSEPQKLFEESRQLEVLDLFAGNTQLLSEYHKDYTTWRSLHKEIKSLETSDRLTDDEIDFIRHQIHQIEQLQISKESIETLEQEFTRMSNAQELLATVARCAELLNDEQALAGPLQQLVSYYESMADLDSELLPLLERARSAAIELQDLGEETERLASQFDFDAAAVEEVTERMDLWQELRRKHGGSVGQVLDKRRELVQKIESQGNVEGVLEVKQKRYSQVEQSLRKQAATLRDNREKAAAVLAEKAAESLLGLGFKQARLQIKMTTKTDLGELGDSCCEFLFAPNAGQSFLPLRKIASSGEMARVMLALKSVLAAADKTPLLVFDEVDANVGGEVGRSVGTKMVKLAERHQVFCVTHLPQVASLAKNHFLVTKYQDTSSTTVSIEPIHDDPSKRLDELARMLGDRNSDSARAHAESLMT